VHHAFYRIELLWRRHRQRPQQDGVDQAECRRARADSQRERQHCRGGRHLVLEELPPREDRVGAERIEPREHAEILALLARVQRAAEGPASFRRIAALLDGLHNVRLELFVDVAAQAIPAKCVGDARPQ
jgi:hypothetical protein